MHAYVLRTRESTRQRSEKLLPWGPWNVTRVRLAMHAYGSNVVAVDVAVVEGHVATLDEHTTTLPYKEGARIWSVLGKYLHGGDGTLQDLVQGELTFTA